VESGERKEGGKAMGRQGDYSFDVLFQPGGNGGVVV
jgi:hypothetical protein